MRKFNKFFISLGLIAAMTMSSCNSDLDVMPEDPNVMTNAEFSQDPEGYMNRVLAACYLTFSTTGVGGASGSANVEGFDGGSGTFQRAIFNLNEIPTDEACWLSAGDSYLSASLQYMQFPANNSAIYGTYSRLIVNISMCNEFIRTVQEGKFGLPENLMAKAEEYCNQARILRGLAYFYLIDLFGNVPYADETVLTGTVAPQLPRAKVYQKVVANLEEVSEAYGSNTDVVYGYVGKDACDALLAKFYLNAEVFSGVPAYDKCWNKCQEIIDRHKGGGFDGSGLANHYVSLFARNNDQYAGGGSKKDQNEILWVIPCDFDNLTSWANTTFLIAAWATSDPGDTEWKINKADYNLTEGWKCMLARRQFVEKFAWNEDGTSSDVRTQLWRTSAHGFSIDNTQLTQDAYGNGYVAIKFTNFPVDDEGNVVNDGKTYPATQFCYADYPVIRLAEIYLTAAEANILGGVGSSTDAVKYVNYIRNRAGLDSWTISDLNETNILDERCRELYQENCRRTDLVRHGKFTGSSYIWNWKGGVAEGTSTSEHLNVYPLPSTVVSLAGYTQNNGYTN